MPRSPEHFLPYQNSPLAKFIEEMLKNALDIEKRYKERGSELGDRKGDRVDALKQLDATIESLKIANNILKEFSCGHTPGTLAIARIAYQLKNITSIYNAFFTPQHHMLNDFNRLVQSLFDLKDWDTSEHFQQDLCDWLKTNQKILIQSIKSKSKAELNSAFEYFISIVERLHFSNDLLKRDKTAFRKCITELIAFDLMIPRHPITYELLVAQIEALSHLSENLQVVIPFFNPTSLPGVFNHSAIGKLIKLLGKKYIKNIQIKHVENDSSEEISYRYTLNNHVFDAGDIYQSLRSEVIKKCLIPAAHGYLLRSGHHYCQTPEGAALLQRGLEEIELSKQHAAMLVSLKELECHYITESVQIQRSEFQKVVLLHNMNEVEIKHAIQQNKQLLTDIHGLKGELNQLLEEYQNQSVGAMLETNRRSCLQVAPLYKNEKLPDEVVQMSDTVIGQRLFFSIKNQLISHCQLAVLELSDVEKIIRASLQELEDKDRQAFVVQFEVYFERLEGLKVQLDKIRQHIQHKDTSIAREVGFLIDFETKLKQLKQDTKLHHEDVQNFISTIPYASLNGYLNSFLDKIKQFTHETDEVENKIGDMVSTCKKAFEQEQANAVITQSMVFLDHETMQGIYINALEKLQTLNNTKRIILHKLEDLHDRFYAAESDLISVTQSIEDSMINHQRTHAVLLESKKTLEMKLELISSIIESTVDDTTHSITFLCELKVAIDQDIFIEEFIKKSNKKDWMNENFNPPILRDYISLQKKFFLSKDRLMICREVLMKAISDRIEELNEPFEQSQNITKDINENQQLLEHEQTKINQLEKTKLDHLESLAQIKIAMQNTQTELEGVVTEINQIENNLVYHKQNIEIIVSIEQFIEEIQLFESDTSDDNLLIQIATIKHSESQLSDKILGFEADIAVPEVEENYDRIKEELYLPMTKRLLESCSEKIRMKVNILEASISHQKAHFDSIWLSLASSSEGYAEKYYSDYHSSTKFHREQLNSLLAASTTCLPVNSLMIHRIEALIKTIPSESDIVTRFESRPVIENHPICEQRMTDPCELSDQLISLLRTYQSKRAHYYRVKDRLFSKDKQARQAFIEELISKLAHCNLSTDSGVIIDFIKIHFSDFPGIHLQPLLNKIITILNDLTATKVVHDDNVQVVLDNLSLTNKTYVDYIKTLYLRIEEMNSFSIHLKEKNDSCGPLLNQLAIELNTQLNEFVVENHERQPTVVAFEKFKFEFNARLHREDDVLSNHTGWGRWVRLVANIALILFTIPKLLISKLTTGRSSFFFEKSEKNHLIDSVEKAMRLIVI